MQPTLLIAAHGTASSAGLATIRDLTDAVAAARPGLTVELCFLDVLEPGLAAVLDSLDTDVVVVPLLLSAGYHVTADIPRLVDGRDRVRVARHLGPDPLIVHAIADRVREVADEPATTVLASVFSSRSSANEEVEAARTLLEDELGRPVAPLPLTGELEEALDELPAPVVVAPYLLAEGTFHEALIAALDGRGAVAAPLGVHPNVVALVLDRFDEAVR